MKKILFIAVAVFSFAAASAQKVLPVPVVTQEQDQWCWAGCSKCILNYYGDSVMQCEIADFTRTVATWHSYGTTPCCTNPLLGCNYPNYNWGMTGSIQDILVHFDGITNHGTGALTLAQMDTQAVHYFPFVCHWSWIGGGGHFVVGNGVDSANNIHYMNPWFGEGAHICIYSWMLNDGSHTYDFTNVLDHCPIAVNAGTISGPGSVLVGNHVTLIDTNSGGTWHCSNAKATVSTSGVVTGVTPGWDTVTYSVSNACGKQSASFPIHITATAGVATVSTGVSADLVVYPNPNAGSFSFMLNTAANEPVQVVVTNILGGRVKEFNTTTNTASTVQLDQPNGIYLLSATTPGRNYVTRVVIAK